MLHNPEKSSIVAKLCDCLPPGAEMASMLRDSSFWIAKTSKNSFTRVSVPPKIDELSNFSLFISRLVALP